MKSLWIVVTCAAVPVTSGPAVDFIESLDHPMTASDTVLRDHVPDPPGGLTTIADAVAAAASGRSPRAVATVTPRPDLLLAKARAL
ncbi:hypothetical protein ORI20_10200 [Mycobacterium sp. CVI_P3]|uniref:Uncharacterized protein n=1 Tax=Mycobacterium pinniadriaticum TaxID=2994102 RepID=A0ABT3SC53_9MYCO|nr:hypothetical protein [Mycobacterium pinniadriaticum]MCX2930649.1 hypothetical protein [Mycobacterium pinniadriaticum]MCX2937073.1 hypothetical protein [Mycobacterium pinniadriaticum]